MAATTFVLFLIVGWIGSTLYGTYLDTAANLKLYVILFVALTLVASVVGYLISMFLFRSNNVLGATKNYKFTLIYVSMFVLDILVIGVIFFSWSYPFGYLLGFGVHLVILWVTYFVISRWYAGDYEKDQMSGLGGIDRLRHDEEHHGWVCLTHMWHFTCMQTVNLIIIYLVSAVAKMYYTSFEHEFYICMASLILVVIANACYRFFDPIEKRNYDGHKITLVIKQETNETNQ